MSKRLNWFLAACLIVSLAASIRLYLGMHHYYALFVSTQLDPLGVKVFEPVPLREAGLPRVVILGDSRAAAWPTPESWQVERQVFNRGVSGQTSAQVLGRFEQHAAALKPQLVLIQVGINDLKAIGLFPERRDEILAACKSNIAELVRLSRARGAVVVLSTILPVGKLPLLRRLVWSDESNRAIAEVNSYLLSLQSEGVIVFDAHSLLVGEHGLIKPEFSHDFLHVNEAGYQHLNIGLRRLQAFAMGPR